MTGWELALHEVPPSAELSEVALGRLLARWPGSAGALLGAWRTDHDGLDWAYLLARSGRAIGPVGDGYPSAFFVQATDVAEVWMEHGGPPREKHPPHSTPENVWGPRGRIIAAICARMQPSDWLLLHCFDDS